MREVELKLCEQYELILKPGILYRFVVDPECVNCVEVALKNLDLLKHVKEICGPCAVSWGGKCSVHTISPGECDMCGEHRGTSPITDYVFPSEYKIDFIWD